MADANIFQGAIFHEDAAEDLYGIAGTESVTVDSQKIRVENVSKSLEAKPRQPKSSPKPAVHRVREQFIILNFAFRHCMFRIFWLLFAIRF